MRILHTMIRVKDLERSKDFYTKLLAMRVLREKDYPAYGFTLAFVGYGEESQSTVIELHHKWDRKDDYLIGDGFGHIAIGVDDVASFFAALKEASVKVVREPMHMQGGTSIVAHILDPDGYQIELVQRLMTPGSKLH